MNGSRTLLLVSSVASLCPTFAAAQGEGATLEEVVVTAQKREERLVDVPMSISVLSGETLADRGFVNIQDLAFAVPGMAMREDGPGGLRDLHARPEQPVRHRRAGRAVPR